MQHMTSKISDIELIDALVHTSSLLQAAWSVLSGVKRVKNALTVYCLDSFMLIIMIYQKVNCYLC